MAGSQVSRWLLLLLSTKLDIRVQLVGVTFRQSYDVAVNFLGIIWENRLDTFTFSVVWVCDMPYRLFITVGLDQDLSLLQNRSWSRNRRHILFGHGSLRLHQKPWHLFVLHPGLGIIVPELRHQFGIKKVIERSFLFEELLVIQEI